MSEESYLIVGLGNPGEKYAHTRHNLGFMVVEKFAERKGMPFQRGWRLKAKIADGKSNEKKVILLKPTTYMNLSGLSVKRSSEYYKVPLSRILIVVDDVYLKFGGMRLRPDGSAGGHNGLKSVEAALQSQNYCRLRLGVGNDNLPERSLEEFVLEDFNFQEQLNLPLFIEKAVQVLEMWVDQGIVAAMQCAGNLSKELNEI